MKTLILLSFLLLAVPTWAMPIEWIDTTVNMQTQTVAFQIQFLGVPDLYTADQYNRQADSFQFYTFVEPQTDNNGLGGAYSLVTSITRGEELHYGDGLPIRDGRTDFADDLTRTGGWGSLTGLVPVIQHGSRLDYTVPLATLGVGPRFGFETFEFGDGTNGRFWGQCTSGSRCSVPEPSPFWLLAAGLMGWIGWRSVRRWREI